MTTIVITTALELSSAQTDQIKKALTKKFGQTITLQKVVDPNILGGVTIKIGSRFIDGSIKNKIDQLSKQLVQAG